MLINDLPIFGHGYFSTEPTVGISLNPSVCKCVWITSLANLTVLTLIFLALENVEGTAAEFSQCLAFQCWCEGPALMPWKQACMVWRQTEKMTSNFRRGKEGDKKHLKLWRGGECGQGKLPKWGKEENWEVKQLWIKQLTIRTNDSVPRIFHVVLSVSSGSVMFETNYS